MQTWDINEGTGDYRMEGGAPVETDSLRVAAYIRLKVRRTKWLYAPSNDYGSDFFQIKKLQSTRDASQVENAAARGLQPLANDGRAKSITIDTDEMKRNGVGLKIKIIEANGTVGTLNLQGMGA